MSKKIKIALVGNPNCGKTTLFNKLTGLNQKVGNFPGVTVEKKTGLSTMADGQKYEIIDLPGSYSLSSTSPDEKVVQDILLNTENESFPDAVVLIADVTNLKRNLFLVTQIIDLGFPVIVALNMSDIAKKKKIQINIEGLRSALSVPIIEISAKKESSTSLKSKLLAEHSRKGESIIDSKKIGGKTLGILAEKCPNENLYRLFKCLNNIESLTWLKDKDFYNLIVQNSSYNRNEAELHEINNRYAKIQELITANVQIEIQNDAHNQNNDNTTKIDKIVIHPVWGFLIFIGVFFLLFQSVFTLAQIPMEIITNGMGYLSDSISNILPAGYISSFITEGLLAGISGILVFLPQIMLLFGLITVLEDSGYLSRISFISDRLLRMFGMNGKSIIPLVGGFACSVPAIMAARSIESRKERLITIFITPLMSCSARLPVYVFLTAFIVPNEMLGGIISLQGLFMMGLYLLGIVFSLIIAVFMNKFLKINERSSFIMELPKYAIPSLKNVFSTMINKGKTFVFEAGKIIIIASVVLWFLSSFGPSSDRERINTKYTADAILQTHTPEEIEVLKSSEKLEYSYIGYIGKSIEPVIKPLGFDWKVGIALITSLAAREVFVGTMTTIYSVGSDKNSKEALASIHFDKPTAFSLLIFYVFALQCMSTIAIVKQETGKWKFAITQFFVFTGMAYLGSFITYQLIR
ncbi:MAG: ferrous iron transport protein B [Flavobacteriales bacterium]|nr:ferrous iron transport protein B [Flavobacteriales bacterium]